MSWLDVVSEIVRGAVLGPNDRLLRQESAGFDETFLSLCLLEAVTARTPATFCLFGSLLDRTAGIERQPLEDLRCC